MNKKGFTLVELIAVVAVLGMIVGFAVFSVTSLVKRAQDNTKKETIENLKDAAIMYCMDNHFKRNVTTPCVHTVEELVNSGDFENKDNICKAKGKVTVTIKTINSTTNKKDYEASVENGICDK